MFTYMMHALFWCPTFIRFTVLWALLTTYGVGMLLKISDSLNKPFGCEIQDIKLNRLSAGIGYELLEQYAACPITREALIDEEHQTPTWLEKRVDFSGGKAGGRNNVTSQAGVSISGAFKRFFSRPISIGLFISLLVYTGWCFFIVFLTRALADDPNPTQPVRWWSLYIPIDGPTLEYIGLGVFLLLGYWLNDAYGRYWEGLQLWHTRLQPAIEHFAFHVTMTCTRGVWHQRDRERILSFTAALPFVMKQHLRGSRDVSEVDEMLSPRDVLAISEAPNMPLYMLDTLSAYMMEVDTQILTIGPAILWTFGGASVMMISQVSTIEAAFFDCVNLLRFPIAPAFTRHLQLFTAFWLAILPLTLVVHDGFLSFLYLIPIAYSILRLLDLGREMSNPFRSGIDSVPLEKYCREIRQAVLDTYVETADGVRHFIHKSPYNRELFLSKPRLGIHEHSANDDLNVSEKVTPTLHGTFRTLIRCLPPVSIFALIAAVLWAVAATFISWGLGFLWDEPLRNSCAKWCSPIDVDPTVLGNIGFALFMILAFRVSDAIGRYENSAQTVYELRMQLRSLAVEVVQAIGDGALHEGDKERIIAHLAQVPLCFRDMLLEIRRTDEEREGLLTEEDRLAFEQAPDPLLHLLKTVHAYFLTADMPDKEMPYKRQDRTVNFVMVFFVSIRINSIRSLIAKILSIKQFSVVGSYVRHQRIFMILWLIFMPFSMTSMAGFFTILWAPLVSYALLCLETIAVKLVDPLGDEATDLPIDRLFKCSSNAILDAANSIDWDVFKNTAASVVDEKPSLGSVVVGHEVYDNYTLPTLEPRKLGNDEVEPEFEGPSEPKMKPSFYAHILRSVPFWKLIAVTIWAVVACIISYYSKVEGGPPRRWWESFISVNSSVTGYLSFGAFTTLGFFVQAAFGRYNRAGSVWGDNLRGVCHSFAALFMCFFPSGEIHKGDTERVIGHIAALPIVLKAELRNSRDIRELLGLLSTSDIARMQCAGSMSTYCFSVIRSYYVRVMTRAATIESKKVAGGRTNLLLMLDTFAMERTIQMGILLKAVPIAPVFIVLVDILLGIWFFILPFVLAEISGWFTILWVPIIAYGLLGTYRVARELKDPFGRDLNDLDLDEMADSIVADVISAYRTHKGGSQAMVRETTVPTLLWDGTMEDAKDLLKSLFRERRRMSKVDKWKDNAMLAARAVPLWILAIVILWSAAIVSVAYVVGRNFEITPCISPWFCSPIAVDNSVKNYIGFALFLLLGFRLNDSHQRYVTALALWQDGVIGGVRLVTNRLFTCYWPNTWHENDIQRLAGHIAAFSICLMGRLRNCVYEDKLHAVVGEEDVQRILAAEEPADYCLDVVRAYMLNGEQIWKKKKGGFGSGIELVRIVMHVRGLSMTMRSCTRLVRIPLPFGYVQHLSIFLFIWVALLPLGLVESSGWVTILWVPIISYGIIGVEKWAIQLADPFGTDISDVDLEKFCERVIAVVKTAVHLYKQAHKPYIQTDRPPFPMIEVDQPMEKPVNVDV